MNDELLVQLHRAGTVLDDAAAVASVPDVVPLEAIGRPPRVQALVGVATCLAALGLILSWTVLRSAPDPRVGTRADEARPSPIVVPEAARVLPAGEDWELLDVDAAGATGEVIFAVGERTVVLRWDPRDAPEIDGPAVEVAGYAGRLGSYGPSDHVVSWRDAEVVVTMRADGGAAEFEEFLRSLRVVDVAAWNEAR